MTGALFGELRLEEDSANLPEEKNPRKKERKMDELPSGVSGHNYKVHGQTNHEHAPSTVEGAIERPIANCKCPA